MVLPYGSKYKVLSYAVPLTSLVKKYSTIFHPLLFLVEIAIVRKKSGALSDEF